jgi:hypothetical protein
LNVTCKGLVSHCPTLSNTAIVAVKAIKFSKEEEIGVAVGWSTVTAGVDRRHKLDVDRDMRVAHAHQRAVAVRSLACSQANRPFRGPGHGVRPMRDGQRVNGTASVRSPEATLGNVQSPKPGFDFSSLPGCFRPVRQRILRIMRSAGGCLLETAYSCAATGTPRCSSRHGSMHVEAAP